MSIHYAFISNGLRGCYASDNQSVIKFTTRKELKNIVAYDARDMQEAGFTGAAKDKVASFVQDYWKRCNSKNPGYLDTVLPLAPSHSRGNYCFGLFLSPATKADFVAQMDD